MRKTIGLVAALAAMVIACSGGSGGSDAGGDANTSGDAGRDSGGGGCPGAIGASWKENGVAYQSRPASAGVVPPFFNITVTACVSSGGEHTVNISSLPYPPAAGTYPLKWKPLAGNPANGYAGALYISGTTPYYTNDTGPDSMGSVVITSVDSTAKTFSGTFSFHATDAAGMQSVDITEGVLTAIKFQ